MPLKPPSGEVQGVSVWRTQAMYRAQSIDISLNLIIDNDFETNTASSTFSAGTGSVAFDTGETGGVARLRTGAVVLTSDALVYNAGGATLIKSPLDESWYAQSRVWIKNTATAVTRYGCIGLQDRLTAPVEYIYFGLLGDQDQTYLTLAMSVGGGAEVPFVSRFAADTSTYHDYGIGRDAVNDKIYAMVDGVPILDLDGPFASLTNNPCFFESGLEEKTALRDVQAWVDHIVTVVKQAT